jgi:hypothetical protein
MELQQEDFSYVDQMINKRREERRLGRILAYDFSELYLYLQQYWRTYWQDDEERGNSLLHLTMEIEYLYNLLYPDEPQIEKNHNTREAGRPKQYDDDFDNKVMSLLQEGFGPTQIASQLGCSKSYVSKLKRKRMVERRNKR